jgi:hypothetical protein
VAQLIVVAQFLVPQRNPEHPLTDQTRHCVLDQISRAVIAKAAAKRSTSRSCRSVAPSSSGQNAATTAPFDRCKTKKICVTICLHRASPASKTNLSSNTIFSDPGAIHLLRLRNAG